MKAETNARRREIRSLLLTADVASQSQLQGLLAGRGFEVTQATVSRDLDAIGADRLKEDGDYRYRIVRDPELADVATETLHEAVDEFVESVATSANLIILKVPPGAAQFVASRVDAADVPGVLGTIAGDDTILVVADEQTGATKVSHRLIGTE